MNKILTTTKFVSTVYLTVLISFYCHNRSFANLSVNDTITLGKNKYFTNTVTLGIRLGDKLNLAGGYFFSQSGSTTTARTIDFSIDYYPTEPLSLYGTVSIYPEIESYKSNTFDGGLSYTFFSGKPVSPTLNLTLGRTAHLQKLYVMRTKQYTWVTLNQTYLTAGLSCTLWQKFAIITNYTTNTYDRDLEKVQELAIRVQKTNTLGLVNGFIKNSTTLGLTYTPLYWLTLNLSYSRLNYALDEYWSNSYLAGLNLYGGTTINLSLNYNVNIDIDAQRSDYFSLSAGYTF